jgi:hypothetical protein
MITRATSAQNAALNVGSRRKAAIPVLQLSPCFRGAGRAQGWLHDDLTAQPSLKIRWSTNDSRPGPGPVLNTLARPGELQREAQQPARDEGLAADPFPHLGWLQVAQDEPGLDHQGEGADDAAGAVRGPRHPTTVWVPNWSSASCDLGVFMYQPAEQIATSQVKLGRRCRRW